MCQIYYFDSCSNAVVNLLLSRHECPVARLQNASTCWFVTILFPSGNENMTILYWRIEFQCKWVCHPFSLTIFYVWIHHKGYKNWQHIHKSKKCQIWCTFSIRTMRKLDLRKIHVNVQIILLCCVTTICSHLVTFYANNLLLHFWWLVVRGCYRIWKSFLPNFWFFKRSTGEGCHDEYELRVRVMS